MASGLKLTRTRYDAPPNWNWVAKRRLVKKDYRAMWAGDIVTDLVGQCFYEDDGVTVIPGRIEKGVFIERFDCKFSNLAGVLDALAFMSNLRWCLNGDAELDFC